MYQSDDNGVLSVVKAMTKGVGRGRSNCARGGDAKSVKSAQKWEPVFFEKMHV